MGLKNSTFNHFRWGIWWFTNGCIFWTNRDRSVPRMVPIVEEASVLVVRGLDQNPSIIPLPICSMVLETSYEHLQQTSPSFVGKYGAYMEHLGYTGWFIGMETSSTCFEHCKHVRLAAINPKMADFAVLSLCSYTSPSMILFMRWEKQTHKTQCVCIFFRLTTSDDSVIPFLFSFFPLVTSGIPGGFLLNGFSIGDPQRAAAPGIAGCCELGRRRCPASGGRHVEPGVPHSHVPHK